MRCINCEKMTQYGVHANFWLVVEIDIQNLIQDPFANVVILGWASQEAWESGAPNLAIERLQLPDIEHATAEVEEGEVNIYELVAQYVIGTILTDPNWEGATIGEITTA